ncbi:MAG: NADH-quinone oxidoreductase subunit C [Desulfotomaculum sp.]|nr:NADH-quinone oxidoreductase subunit C [Desulfotomaculum sp.]
MYRLRDEYEFNYLTDETAVDYGDYFEVIYNLSRVPQGDILMVKTKVDKEKAEVPSVFEVWPGAIWFEREIFDLLGIKFTNHPDLRRILLDDSFEGHPLRKDFQWVGGREV